MRIIILKLKNRNEANHCFVSWFVPMFLCVELSLGDDMFESSKNPLEEVTAGLLDSTGQQLPLQAVHVKCKLMDLLSQVTVAHRVFSVFSLLACWPTIWHLMRSSVSLLGHHLPEIHKSELSAHWGKVCFPSRWFSCSVWVRGFHQREACRGTGNAALFKY